MNASSDSAPKASIPLGPEPPPAALTLLSGNHTIYVIPSVRHAGYVLKSFLEAAVLGLKGPVFLISAMATPLWTLPVHSGKMFPAVVQQSGCMHYFKGEST